MVRPKLPLSNINEEQALALHPSNSINPNYAIFLLILIYIVGIIGIRFNVYDGFIYLTPLNLVISLNIALWFHPNWTARTSIFFLLCYFVGFFAELIGVNTSLLFGSYSYGKVLGTKIFGTPLMIGVNWMLVTYCASITINHIFQHHNWLIRGLLASFLMVALDFIIEPVAIKYGFWTWVNETVPFQNYIGWFMVSLPLTFSFALWHPDTKNKVAVALLVLQFFFFLILQF